MLARLVGESNSTKTKWTELSCQMVDRTPKQCRDRYNNSLKPDGKKGRGPEKKTKTSYGCRRSLATNGAKFPLVSDVDLFVVIL